MPLNRLPDLFLSNQTLTGVSADYLDGITSSTISQSLRANRNLTGGGTITFDASGNLFWSSRFIVISNGRGTHFSVDGYYDIYCPTSGTITGVGGSPNKTATGAGINLASWDALYVVLPIGSGSYVNQNSFRIALYTVDLEVPHDWLLIAVRNGDDGLVYLNNGVILAPGQSQRGDSKSYVRIGTSDTENYIAFRGTTGDEPGNYTHTYIGERLYGGSESSELFLFKGNDIEGVAGPDRIRLSANNLVFDTFSAGAVSGTFSTVASSGLNVTRMIIKQNGNIGIGTTSPDTIGVSSIPAMLGIVSNAVGTVGLVVKGIASQTASLQQWQNSSGTILAQFSAGGDFAMSSATRAFFGGSSANAYLNVSTAGNPVRQGIIVSGGVSQTGNLQEWQDSAGTVISRINPSGHLIASSRSMFGGATSIISGMIIAAVSQETAATPILARGSATQTANLTEWQNSAGTVLSSINPSGFLSTPRINFTGGTSTVSALALSDGTLSFESTAGQLFSISNSLTGTIFSVNDISGLPIVEATDLGIVKINELYGQTVFGSGTPVANTMLTSIARTATSIPIVAKGAASQSADLQQWQDSAGTVMGRIDGQYGTIRSVSGIDLTNTYTGASTITARVNYPNTTPVTIIGAASQTANLQVWQNSAGTVQARIASNGDFTNNGIFTVYGRFGGASFTDAAALRVNGYNTAVPTAVIKAIASQTANLQEWQDSAGSVLSRIDSAGSLISETVRASVLRAGNWASLPSGTVAAFSTCTTASTVGFIVKAAASQTANLQEWQDSAGTVLSFIRSDGFARLDQGFQFGTMYSYAGAWGVDGGNSFKITQSSAAYSPLIVKGATSQTADLQQWQNSAGTVLAKVDASGNFVVNGVTISQSASSVNATQLGTVNNRVFLKEENSGGQLRLTKSTASAANNRATDLAQLYLRDGTTAGTLKLVIIAGTTGAETTILDNIPQS